MAAHEGAPGGHAFDELKVQAVDIALAHIIHDFVGGDLIRAQTGQNRPIAIAPIAMDRPDNCVIQAVPSTTSRAAAHDLAGTRLASNAKSGLSSQRLAAITKAMAVRIARRFDMSCFTHARFVRAWFVRDVPDHQTVNLSLQVQTRFPCRRAFFQTISLQAPVGCFRVCFFA